MIVAVDHVLLAAPPGAEERLRAYCVDVLGTVEIAKPPVLAARGGYRFRAGEAVPHLGMEEAPAGGADGDGVPPKKAHPGWRVSGIEGCAARPAGSGAPVTWDDDLPGYRRFCSEDPVGNRLEFLEPV
ncbi:glyoxalase [Streptomyces ipomoeae]|uniref:glyoxalase n=1 Tax=Streptomyces ipomoeae TaxID=103232 RepID=UPI0011467BF3|nr:glyoxalase [Streptomyces ipomoeae]MDX2933161.1 glyoxalase [Streptomyces ipomoeae]TQE19846.1 glyoxalase [Streptomyces ipomoeae]